MSKSPTISALLILALTLTACGGKRTQKIPTPSKPLISLPTSQIVEHTQPAEVQTATEPSLSPTDTTQPAMVIAPPGTNYHYPPGRSFNRSRPHRIGLLTASEDPFDITLANGAKQSAVNLGVELFAQLPQSESSTEQAQMLDAMLARGDLDALIVSPIDPQALIPGLQKAVDAGMLIITLQTDLADNPGVIPLMTFHSDEGLGGAIACQALVGSLAVHEGETEKTPAPPKKVYLQRGKPGMLDPDARQQGCEQVLAQAADIQLSGVDNHEDDPLKASQQALVALANNPDLAGIVCTDIICSQAASQALASQGLIGKVKIAAMDATPEAVSLLRQGSIDFLATPKPYEMGYLGVGMATAGLDGVTSLPASLSTGWEMMTPQNAASPAIARWFYSASAKDPQRTTAGLKIAFIAGIDDPFYYTMQRGVQQAASSLGATLLAQFPLDWSAAEQAQIIGNLSSSNKLNALLLVPTDPLALLPSLQSLSGAGIPVLALDTPLDPSFSPLAFFSSNHQVGGYFACRSLAQAIGGSGKVYIQSVAPGIPATDARERGCQQALSELSGITLVAVNYNEDDPAKAQAQLATILTNHPDLSAVFCTDVVGGQAVGQYLGSQGLSGKVKVAAFDATSATVDLLRSGVIDMVVAQEPADMGYLAVFYAVARLDGISDLPATLSTGFVLLNRENMDDPEYSRFFYLK